jgi:hypothetical protein
VKTSPSAAHGEAYMAANMVYRVHFFVLPCVFRGTQQKKGKNDTVIETVGKQCEVGGDFVVLHFRTHNEKLNGNKKRNWALLPPSLESSPHSPSTSSTGRRGRHLCRPTVWPPTREGGGGAIGSSLARIHRRARPPLLHCQRRAPEE